MVKKYRSVISMLMWFWSEISRMFFTMFLGLIILKLKKKKTANSITLNVEKVTDNNLWTRSLTQTSHHCDGWIHKQYLEILFSKYNYWYKLCFVICCWRRHFCFPCCAVFLSIPISNWSAVWIKNRTWADSGLVVSSKVYD